MGNGKQSGKKKEIKINKIKAQLERLRAKLKADNDKKELSIPQPELKKIKPKPKQPKKMRVEVKPKPKQPKKMQVEVKPKPKQPKKMQVEVKPKPKQPKKSTAKIKAVEQRKAKEARKKAAKIKVEEKRKAKEEAKRKEEEDRKKEEEARRTYEEELEEQLTEEEITGFQLEKTDMDKMCNKVCEIIAEYENNGIFQSQLWKKFKLSSRDGSRLALKLERMGMITREKILEKERWTYKLIIKKIPISTKSIEGAPCLTCPVESKCIIDGEVSPKTCQWIEDWVMIELKNK